MTHKRVVLITGVAGYWGGQVTGALLTQSGLHVLGLDEKPPEPEIKGLDFVQTNLDNPALVDLLREEKVDTVCHLTFVDSLRPNEAAFETNVMGTMHLLGACAEAGVRKVVLKSSTLVYGAQPTNSAFLCEDQPLHGSKSYGYIRDLVEIEAFCNGFQRQYPHILMTLLRFAHIVGPKADTPLTRFLREEEALLLLGFDPMMQVIHADDVVRALVHAVIQDVPGAFNVAAEGALPLWKLMGLAGKLALPVVHPLAYASVSLLGPRYAPIDLDYLRYPCVGDLERMHTALKFVPHYTAEETLREFASQQRLRRYVPESLARAFEEERLRDTIERRRRAREQAASEAERPRRRSVRRRKKAQPAVELNETSHEEALNHD
jgi:UDP-glucose 4-epimerase